ncbi:hypothetical protein ACJX0J_010645, partial [Zea mays]
NIERAAKEQSPDITQGRHIRIKILFDFFRKDKDLVYSEQQNYLFFKYRNNHVIIYNKVENYYNNVMISDDFLVKSIPFRDLSPIYLVDRSIGDR